MKKTNKKMIAILLALILVASFIPFSVFAQITGNFNVKFGSASWDVGGTNVTATVANQTINTNAEVELTVNEEITLTNFDPDTMEVRISEDTTSQQAFSTTLAVDANGKTSLSTANAEGLPSNTLIFVVQPKPQNNGGGTGEQTCNVNFGTASWTVGTKTVTASIEGKTINNSSNVTITKNDVITLSNYDEATMEVYIVEQGEGDVLFSTILPVDKNGDVYSTKLANHNGGLVNNMDFIVRAKTSGNEGGEGGENNNPQFDGNAYFVWINSDNTISYHKFTGLFGRPEPGSTEGYKMNYISATELVDQSGNNKNYTWGQENANWVLAGDMEDENGAIRTDLTKQYLFGTGVYNADRRIENGVQLDPCGAENGANSICTNGDRKFRATIYRDGYNAIQFSANQNDYTYFPCFWDQMFFSSTIDVSGTTKENPSVYTTYLLEPTIRFSKGQFSGTITKVEALDVNPDAVNISIVEGTCIIKFNSNFYDHVVFKITAGGQEYFVKIQRIVIDIKDNFGPTTTDTKLIGRFFIPTNKDYESFEVIATIINKDGTTETKVLSADKLAFYDSDDHNREIAGNQYMLNGGKGLYECQYYISVDNMNIAGAYFTVVNKGALDTSENTFGGTFSGSEKGSYYNAATRRIEL